MINSDGSLTSGAQRFDSVDHSARLAGLEALERRKPVEKNPQIAPDRQATRGDRVNGRVTFGGLVG